MAEEKLIRLGQASRKLNVGHNTILDFLAKKGFSVENNPNAKLTPEQYTMLAKEYASSASEKLEASSLTIGIKPVVENLVRKSEPETHRKKVDEEENVLIKNLGSKDIIKHKEEPKAEITTEPKPEKVEVEKTKLEGIKVLGKIDLAKESKKETKKEPKKEPAIVEPEEIKSVVEEKIVEAPKVPIAEKPVELELIKAKAEKLQGLKVLHKIELPSEKKTQPVASSDLSKTNAQKRPRKRLPNANEQRGNGSSPSHSPNHGHSHSPRPHRRHQRNRRRATHLRHRPTLVPTRHHGRIPEPLLVKTRPLGRIRNHGPGRHRTPRLNHVSRGCRHGDVTRPAKLIRIWFRRLLAVRTYPLRASNPVIAFEEEVQQSRQADDERSRGDEPEKLAEPRVREILTVEAGHRGGHCNDRRVARDLLRDDVQPVSLDRQVRLEHARH